MDEELYCVVRNGEEQYSVWLQECSLPAGWETVGEAATKQQCLERIEQIWTDLTPRSVREHLDRHAAMEVDRVV